MNRRRFLAGTLAGAAALPLVNPASLFAAADEEYLKNIGLQLWTVRNQMGQDSKKTLSSVAKAGYKQVELMNVMDSIDIAKQAKDVGLNVTSAFFDWQSIGNPGNKQANTFDKILETAKSMDLKFLIFGYIGKGHRETLDHFKGHAERANAAGEKCKQAGIQLCYHNHSFEYKPIDESSGWDVFCKEFDHQFVQFELDVFWLRVGGLDPISEIDKLSGRVAQIHLKDMLKGTGTIYDEGKVPKEAFQELGDGTIDMQKVLKHARKAGAKQCHVEQDQSPDPIASIGQSMNYLNELH